VREDPLGVRTLINRSHRQTLAPQPHNRATHRVTRRVNSVATANNPPPETAMPKSGSIRSAAGKVDRISLDDYDGQLEAKAKARSKRAKAPSAAPVNDAAAAAWALDDRAFPESATDDQKLAFALRWAVLAPSSHNTQPWKFRLTRVSGRDGLELLADRARALPVVDPDDRELTISCGCALELLCLALSRFGMAHQVKVLPDPLQSPDVMARITLRGSSVISTPELRLFEAIKARRTDRRAFLESPVASATLDEAARLAAARAASAQAFTDPSERRALAALVAESDVLQLQSTAFRRELALWMHHNRTHSQDGIPGYALNLSEITSILAPLVVRTFDVGKGRAAADEQLALHSAAMIVVGTAADTSADWIAAGRATAAIALHTTAAGLSHSYLNQPCELPATRAHLRRLVPSIQCPQIVLRVGRPAPGQAALRHTPRRPVQDVLIR
jgi:hypothetical protein